ncbi:MAG: FAD-binding protein [Anaerolineaceae bacterium]|nr:FAD-binding protein [Anaerolineaceae bacterium]
MSTYQTIQSQHIEALSAIVGEKNLIHDDVEKLTPYASDEISDKRYARMPEVVVKPASAEQISAIMKLANAERIPVTPRGAGTGLTGGVIPLYGGIVLSLERMNRILEIDPDNLVVVVEPGVVTSEINEATKDLGLFYAGYPMSLESCFIGGNVATNAGGGKAVKYGVTSRYVLGLEVVLPTGEIVEFGGKRVKDVVGYDMVHLLVGSEGTLGIFTKIILKLMPLPKARMDLLVLFRSIDEAIAMIPRVLSASGALPTAIEFMDQQAVRAAVKYLNEDLPVEEAGALLLIEVDGSSQAEIDAIYEQIGDSCEANGAIEVYVAPNSSTQERVWALRRNIAEALMTYSNVQTSEDVVVPLGKIPALMNAFQQLAEKYETVIPSYGHAGDGNVHVRIIKKPEMPLEDWDRIKHDLLEELFRAVAALGGTISGEHGIGSKKKEFVPIVLSEKVIDLQRGIKAVFDPNQILNPGKIFPDRG